MVTILTLRLNAEAQAQFEIMRQAYFPPERNQIAAHLTLFHALPDALWVEEALAAIAGRTRRFPMMVTGLRSLGRGVAYTLASPAVQDLHGNLASTFEQELIAQDRQRFQPHVVVQNKVSPAAARELLGELQESFAPWELWAEGLDLWHYLGGPWRHARGFAFAPA